MNAEKEAIALTPLAADVDEISFLDLLIIIAKHKIMIFFVTLATGIVALLIALSLPNIYTATAKVLPPQQNQAAAGLLLGQLGGLASVAGGSLGLKNPNDLFVGMIRSRTVADSIIARFDLQRHYGTKTMSETRNRLASNSAVTAGKDGLITVEFSDTEPSIAAAITNAYVEELDKLTQSLAVTEAAQRRLFFERQLVQAKEDLAKSEVALKATQEKTGLIKLDDQGRAIIEAAATVRAQISAKQVELAAMRTFATEHNSEYVRVRQQLAGLRVELAKLEREPVAADGDILLSAGKVPEAGLEYLRKFRDVRYHETIFELLAKHFEAAKIDEAKEAAIIQVVDKAVVPDRKSNPGRAFIVLTTSLVAFIVALVLAFLREAIQRTQQDTIGAARLATLRRHVAFRRS